VEREQRLICCSRGPVGRLTTVHKPLAWTGHRSAHWTDSSCGEPVATVFAKSL
jgi:hypothetical protein